MEEIKNISNIIMQKFNKEVIDKNEELLGEIIKMQPLELAMLLKILEEMFNIVFQAEDITRGLFNNVANIELLLEKELRNQTDYSLQ